MAFPWLADGSGPPNKGKRTPDHVRAKQSESRKKLMATGWTPSNWGKKMNYSEEMRAKLRANLSIAQQNRKSPHGTKSVWGSRYTWAKCPDHPSANSQGWIPEHRMVAENALGRHLIKGEVVHHINGDKCDNRNSNLLICTKSYHHWLHNRMTSIFQHVVFGGKDGAM